MTGGRAEARSIPANKLDIGKKWLSLNQCFPHTRACMSVSIADFSVYTPGLGLNSWAHRPRCGKLTRSISKMTTCTSRCRHGHLLRDPVNILYSSNHTHRILFDLHLQLVRSKKFSTYCNQGRHTAALPTLCSQRSCYWQSLSRVETYRLSSKLLSTKEIFAIAKILCGVIHPPTSGHVTTMSTTEYYFTYSHAED